MYYIYDEITKKPIQVADVVKWSKWMTPERKNLFKYRLGNFEVSTVFLGMDHGRGSKKPLLWETMIFCERHHDLDEYQDRYHSFEDAVKGHEKAVRLLPNVEVFSSIGD